MLHRKTIVSLCGAILCLCMAFSCLSVFVFAETDSGEGSGGSTAVPCIETDCDGSYENGFCSANGAHYQAPEGAGTAESPYQIANAGNLYWFSAKVNSGSTDIHAKLTANIVVNPGTFDADGKYTAKNGETVRAWTPIGNGSNGYTGTFDGRNYTISGLYYSGSDSYVGLFGFISGGASIKNVGIADNYFCVSGGTWVYLGGLVGGAEASSGSTVTVEACYHSGTIVATKNTSWTHVGGLVGSMDCGYGATNITIKQCYNTGSITHKEATGTAAYIGGLVGEAVIASDGGPIVVENCHNSGTVSDQSSSASVRLGGLLGSAVANASLFTLQNSYNTGAVNSASAGARVGGLIGNTGEDNGDIKIKNCYNTETVAATAQGASLGGLVGYADLQGMESAMSIEASYNTGAVSGTSDGASLGGLVGYLHTYGNTVKVTLQNCYNTGTVQNNESNSHETSVGGMVGYVEVEYGEVILKNGYNTGAVSSSTSVNVCVGTLGGSVSIGNSGKMSIQNSYWLNSLGENKIGGEDTAITYDKVEPKSTDEFASGAVAWLLNGSTSDGVWKQTLETDKSPYFTGKTVYQTYKCNGAILTGYANQAVWTINHAAYNATTGICDDCKQTIVATTEIGDEKWYHETLEAAFKAASGKKAVITLLRNTTLTGTIELNATATDATLVGGTYTVSAECTMFRITAGTLTVQSGTYVTTSGNVIEVSGSVSDPTASSGSSSSSGDLTYIPSIGTKLPVSTVGTVNISGGSFTSKSGYAVYVGAASSGDSVIEGTVVAQGTANISGGSFTSESSYAVYVDKASSSASIGGAGGKLNVSGGSFGKLYVVGAPSDTVVLSGGSFKGIALEIAQLSSVVLKSGYAFYTEDENNEYTVLTAGTDIADKAFAVKLCTHTDTNDDGACDICKMSVVTVSVTITWTSMEFTYTDGTWDPNTHSYREGAWSTSGGTVTVENTSGVTITASFAYTTDRTDISGSFDRSSFELAGGEQNTTRLTLAGKPNSALNGELLGSITVSIAKKSE